VSYPNKISKAMQDEAIQIAEQRLGHPLTGALKEKICLERWGFMGLEAIIDTVSTIETEKIERYIENLDR